MQLTATWTQWAERLLPHVMRPDARVLIDGRSGSGKSTLAQRLVELAEAAGTSVQCIHLEDIYPGWDGLESASNTIVTDILAPLHDQQVASWTTYDWHAAEPGPRLAAQPDVPVILEGTGALTRASKALATFSIWIDASEEFRRDRALNRDGDTYRPHWQRWADQEVDLLARERSPEIADVVIDATTVEEMS